MRRYETCVLYTKEEAYRLANKWSQRGFAYENSLEYNTAMKGKPATATRPDHCWYVTNRFDPNCDKQ